MMNPFTANPESTSGLHLPTVRTQAPFRVLQRTTGLLSGAWNWVRARQFAQSTTRRLRVTETVSLGEKRFVAVIQFDGQQFLVGGGATNVALLAQLGAKEEFSEVLKATMNDSESPPTETKAREQA